MSAFEAIGWQTLHKISQRDWTLHKYKYHDRDAETTAPALAGPATGGIYAAASDCPGKRTRTLSCKLKLLNSYVRTV